MAAGNLWDESDELSEVESYLDRLIGDLPERKLDHSESACEALLEFADRTEAAKIGSDGLADFMQELLSIHLIEPHASCRRAATVVAASAPGLDARQTASCLRQMARGLCQIPGHSPASTNGAATGGKSSASRSFAVIPEWIASCAFTAIGVTQLVCWLRLIGRDPLLGWDNWQLSLICAGAYLLTGALFFVSALRQRHSRPIGQV